METLELPNATWSAAFAHGWLSCFFGCQGEQGQQLGIGSLNVPRLGTSPLHSS